MNCSGFLHNDECYPDPHECYSYYILAVRDLHLVVLKERRVEPAVLSQGIALFSRLPNDICQHVRCRSTLEVRTGPQACRQRQKLQQNLLVRRPRCNLGNEPLCFLKLIGDELAEALRCSR